MATFERHLDIFNLPRYLALKDHVKSAIDAVINTARYELLQLRQPLSRRRPLVVVCVILLNFPGLELFCANRKN